MPAEEQLAHYPIILLQNTPPIILAKFGLWNHRGAMAEGFRSGRKHWAGPLIIRSFQESVIIVGRRKG